MSTDRDVTRIVRSWLEEGRTALPDRVLDTVLDQLPATRQRRARWPARRFGEMNAFTKFAVAAAAVVVVAVAGIMVFPRTGGIGGPGPTAVPAPTPTPISLPVDPQELTVTVPGRYLAGAPFQIPVTFNLPADWAGKVGGPYAAYLYPAGVNSITEIALTLSQTIYADPCHDRGFLSPQPGPTVDSLVAALSSLPGFVATTPTEVTIDGYSGKQLMLTAPADFSACTLSSDGYRLWRLPLGGIQSFHPGQRTTLWIVDVNGKRLIISSDSYQTTSARELVEVQGILDSIHIQR
jgi:hypothetical protein